MSCLRGSSSEQVALSCCRRLLFRKRQKLRAGVPGAGNIWAKLPRCQGQCARFLADWLWQAVIILWSIAEPDGSFNVTQVCGDYYSLSSQPCIRIMFQLIRACNSRTGVRPESKEIIGSPENLLRINTEALSLLKHRNRYAIKTNYEQCMSDVMGGPRVQK